MIEDYDGYNGWSNRETWATALHINNDKESYYHAQSLAEGYTDDKSGLADALEEYVTELLDADWDGVKPMRYDIGSLWRVNWMEIAESFMSEMAVN